MKSLFIVKGKIKELLEEGGASVSFVKAKTGIKLIVVINFPNLPTKACSFEGCQAIKVCLQLASRLCHQAALCSLDNPACRSVSRPIVCVCTPGAQPRYKTITSSFRYSVTRGTELPEEM